ncbi:MAG: acetate/propionate family kinase [Steroidobacter sp.]
MRILALNCGSSSIKCALIDTTQHGATQDRRLFDARVENIGSADSVLRIGDEKRDTQVRTSDEALQLLLAEVAIAATRIGPVDAIAHRIVHGGEQFIRPVLIDGDVLGKLERLAHLAPLHNPPAFAALRRARAAFPELPHVAVFDTAFHSTLPPRAREYALPADVRQQFGVRRYGFHGVSHEHVMQSVAAHLRTEPQSLRIISCHLGAGASITAIEYGRSVETSMGMTPLEGLVMGTRAGDVDPGVLLNLLHSGMSVQRLDELLNKCSGLAGLTGAKDMRAIESRAADGDEACRLAINLYAHRLRKYIGAYAAVMGGVDVIAFTGGVGENSALIRHRCTQRLEFLGAVLDEDRNRDVKLTREAPLAAISDERSRTRLLMVRADEEASMVRDTAVLLVARSRKPPRARIPIAVSARHVHLTQSTIEKIFGAGYRLRELGPLSQTGQYAAEETIALIGPRGRIDKVRLMGPPRDQDQIEVSRSDEFTLGLDAPVRISGDLANTPGITIEGPTGRFTLASGVICARRHIHMSTSDAERLGVRDHQSVSVRIDSEGRDLVFGDVTVRVAADFQLEMHLDTDEANAAGLKSGDAGELILD